MKVEELMVGNLVVYFDGETPVFVVVRKINGDDGIVCLRQSDGHVFNTTMMMESCACARAMAMYSIPLLNIFCLFLLRLIFSSIIFLMQ